MATERNRIEINLAGDPRLLRGLVGAVEHFAERAGLDCSAQQNLMEATEQLCLESFKLLPRNDGTVRVAIQDFPDRVEVTLEHHGEAHPAVGLDTFARFGSGGSEASDPSGLWFIARVDRLLYHAEDDTSRITLIKYLR